MRYISPFHRLTLYTTKGSVAYIFKNGELVVGDTTTTNGTDLTTIVATHSIIYAQTYKGVACTLHKVKALPFDGAAASTEREKLETVGMGYLEGGVVSSLSISPLELGWQGRLFFEAPYISATSTPVAGAWYKVHNGKVTYNGTVYKAGQSFKTASASYDITIASGETAIYSLELPIEMRSKCCDSLAEQFKIKHLEHGDEPLSYFLWDTPSGFEPRSSLLTSDEGFIGHSR